ncbi:TRAP transporter large permease [Verrucomicrobia bacterium]|nr:TRAP transporter large permease [Verrucomicrobiota bacterium]MDB4664832.1 TRAP transporter large permease [Verrucomicrobiota bacterium]
MISPVLLMAFLFLVFLCINMPVAVAICLSTLLTATLSMGAFDIAAATVAQRMATGVYSFSLLAIPFFILSGLLMGQGGIASRLTDLASALVGRFPGGLAFVNILSCMLFGAVSGSATAAVSSIGGFIIPEMERKGYGREFSTAITITSATTGLLIPPSNIMIIYALVSGGMVSIGTLFVAGILPGITFGCLLMLVAGILCKKHGLGQAEPQARMSLWAAFRRAFLSLLLIVIVLGGILKGIFTATEAAAIAVAYAFLLSVVLYREIPWKNIPDILLQTGVTTAVVFLLIASSMAMSWILTLEDVPQQISSLMLAVSDNPIVILLLINLLLLMVGTFMDMTPAVLIFTPILWPVVENMGMHPVHFGIMLIANLCIGLCTPPVGTCLFVGCGVGKTSIAKVTPAALPFFAALLVALMLVTFIPSITTWLPGLFGML